MSQDLANIARLVMGLLCNSRDEGLQCMVDMPRSFPQALVVGLRQRGARGAPNGDLHQGVSV